MLYLDNCATTKVLEEVKIEMMKYLSEEYGNPSAKFYDLAVNSKNAVENARSQVTELLSCGTDEIIFTSGASESNNMIIKGFLESHQGENRHIITTLIEHSSVYEVFKYLELKGFEVTYLKPDRNGFIDPLVFRRAIKDNTVFASIVFVNSELGTINDINTLSAIAREKNVFFHSDITQAVGKMEINLEKYAFVDSLSLSAHKFGGPKGVGVLYLRKNKNGLLPTITPLIHGGDQEHGFRAGTLSVHNIVGMGKACEICRINLKNNINSLIRNEKLLHELLQKKFGDVLMFNNDFNSRVPGIISVRFRNINNQILLKEIAPMIAASSGSACSNTKPSRILQACGYSLVEVRESVRFSLSPYQKLDDLYLIEEL